MLAWATNSYPAKNSASQFLGCSFALPINDEDLKGLAVLLASEASRHITGQAIAVDGGATVI